MPIFDPAILLLQLGFLLALAFLLGRLAERVGLPATTGELATGLLLGPSVLGAVASANGSDWLFAPASGNNESLLGIAAFCGVLLVGVAGATVDLGFIRARTRTVGLISLGALGLPVQLASDLDLKDFLDHANGKLSAGQKTRVALAKALINQPELLLLDEPTASLDPDTADWVRRHLLDYRRTHDATILLASHNMLEVERLCDRVIIMKRGRIEDDDSPDQIMARYNRNTLEEVFLDVARGRVAEGTSS